MQQAMKFRISSQKPLEFKIPMQKQLKIEFHDKKVNISKQLRKLKFHGIKPWKLYYVNVANN